MIVNCFPVRDTVVFSPLCRFHIAVMAFSFGRESVVLSPEFTVFPQFGQTHSLARADTIERVVAIASRNEISFLIGTPKLYP